WASQRRRDLLELLDRLNPTRNRKSGLGNPPPTAGASELYPNQNPPSKSRRGEQTAQACANAWLRQLSVNSRRRGRNFPSYCNFVCTPLGLPSEECSGEIGRDIVFFGSNCPARTLKLRCAEGFFLR